MTNNNKMGKKTQIDLENEIEHLQGELVKRDAMLEKCTCGAATIAVKPKKASPLEMLTGMLDALENIR